MPLIKDKIYVYVNTFVTGSIGHTPGQEFKCIDPENKVFEPPISDLGYINFYCKYYGFSIPLDIIEKHNQNFQKLVIIPKDKRILQYLIANTILNLN